MVEMVAVVGLVVTSTEDRPAAAIDTFCSVTNDLEGLLSVFAEQDPLAVY